MTFWRLSVLARYPDFRRLFVGNSVSLLGSSVTAVALPLTAVVYLHAAPAQLGVLGALAFAPQLVLGLPAGVWVDRLPYRRVLVLADLAQALLVGSIPVLALFGALRLWHLYIVVLLTGAANLFETVTAQSFTPALVSRDDLLPANSALMVSNASVNTAGSAVGGLLVVLLTAPIAIAVDAVSFLVAGLTKARIQVAGGASSVRPKNLWVGVFEGLRAVFGHRTIRAVTIAATVGALAGQMQNVVLVFYLVRTLDFPPGLVGVVIAIAGGAGILGALLATPITRRIGPGRAFITGLGVAAAAGLLVAGPFVVLVLASQLFRGAGPSLYGVNQQTFRQALIAPELLSRANATWRFLVYGTQTLGALLGGVLGSVASARVTLLVSGGAMALATAIALFSPLRHRTVQAG
ncbi:MFS transporter [Fodinicola feengrottensis]|uniref:MFS transporter n=1 Tax=Fodinicola feengrottensis TaxID=435914 RepID=A0ABN2J9J2_9ACTN